MRIVIAAVVLCCGIASASPAVADITTAAPPTTAQTNPKSDRVVCRREETVGTLFAKSVCMTLSQWKDREQIAHDQKDQIIDDQNRQQIQNPNPPPAGGH